MGEKLTTIRLRKNPQPYYEPRFGIAMQAMRHQGGIATYNRIAGAPKHYADPLDMLDEMPDPRRAPTHRHARNCELARVPKCHCRCKGLLHGAKRGSSRAFFEGLPVKDPHHVPRARRLRANPKRRTRSKTRPARVAARRARKTGRPARKGAARIQRSTVRRRLYHGAWLIEVLKHMPGGGYPFFYLARGKKLIRSRARAQRYNTEREALAEARELIKTLSAHYPLARVVPA